MGSMRQHQGGEEKEMFSDKGERTLWVSGSCDNIDHQGMEKISVTYFRIAGHR